MDKLEVLITSYRESRNMVKCTNTVCYNILSPENDNRNHASFDTNYLTPNPLETRT